MKENTGNKELAPFTKVKINPERPFSSNNPQYIDPSALRDADEYGWAPNKFARSYWKTEKKQE